jgi:hypothetical protein
MITFANLLGYISLFGILAIILYGMWSERQDIALRARKMALGEAAAALQSLADVAGQASEERRRDGLKWDVAASRAYHFQRAAYIVGSIPVDRL